MQASFRWHDNEVIDADRQLYNLNPCLLVIPAKAGIQEGGPKCQADYAGDTCRDNP